MQRHSYFTSSLDVTTQIKGRFYAPVMHKWLNLYLRDLVISDLLKLWELFFKLSSLFTKFTLSIINGWANECCACLCHSIANAKPRRMCLWRNIQVMYRKSIILCSKPKNEKSIWSINKISTNMCTKWATMVMWRLVSARKKLGISQSAGPHFWSTPEFWTLLQLSHLKKTKKSQMG